MSVHDQSRWRNHCRPIIAEVLAANAGKPDAEIRKALHDAYPYGPRKHHPYQIWLSEIAIQTGRKEPLGKRKAKVQAGDMTKPDERQAEMF